jgi:hypothetical protein
MFPIHIKTIPHNEQRYPTTGDYWRDADGVGHIRVSDVGNSDYEFLVMVHELVEWRMSEKRGITDEAISNFDMKFEEEIKAGIRPPHADPGLDPAAPYRNEHIFATKIEKEIAEELGVDWGAYCKELEKLYILEK